MTPVRHGAKVEPQPPFAKYPTATGPLREVDEHMDLLVIGGGPAGLAAATVAAEAGLDVTLVDERSALGGQYFKQPAEGFEIDYSRTDRQFRRGRELIDRAGRAGVRLLLGVTVWAADSPSELRALGPGVSYLLRPKRLVIATGAYDQAVPMPGWTLPGVMTTGAAQTLLRSYQVSPGRRVLISGNGPLNIQLAAELTRAGARVVALAETAPSPGVRSAYHLARMMWAAADLVRDGAGYLLTLRRARVPTLYRHSVISASGEERVTHATVAGIGPDGRAVEGTQRTFEVDAVCMGFGFLPSNEIARALGCQHRFDSRRAQLVADRDGRGRTSLEGVAVVGDGGGLGGARIAAAQGVLAGADAVQGLGVRTTRRLALEVRRAERQLHRNAAFQQALWSLFDAPLVVDQLATADTLICRCEEVTRGTIEAVIDAGAESLGAIKRVTRAGMGRCQGRYCAGFIGSMLQARGGHAPDELGFFAPRVPFKPVRIGAVAPGRFSGSPMARRGVESPG